MQPLSITDHSLAGWSAYAKEIGFVPDPMILRTGEVFLNGARGIRVFEKKDFEVWDALKENIGGLLDFFDLVVTRDTIPLINYFDTFPGAIAAPLDQMLPDRMRPVQIDYPIYSRVKEGALLALAEFNLADLKRFGHMMREFHALGYEWEPELSNPPVDAVLSKFSAVDDVTRKAAQFLLGGLIFSGFAQASRCTHYIQPKRARFFLGLTAAPDRAGAFSDREEDTIFITAAERLRGTEAEIHSSDPVPPVLPYLLSQGDVTNVRELLDRALAFRESPQGRHYRKAVNSIRADGIQARRTEEAVEREREEALALLAPYSKLDAARSRSLELKLSAETVGIPFVKGSVETTAKIGVPNWLHRWWNDYVPFGGMHKTLRRMWMAAESYRDLSRQLGDIWAKS